MIKSRSKAKRLRGCHGAFLIELLVAIMLGSVTALLLANGISELVRLSRYSQNDLLASTTLQNLMDRVRSNYCEIQNWPDGSYVVTVNRPSSSASNDVNKKTTYEPLLVDADSLVWKPRSTGDVRPSSFLDGSADMTLSTVPSMPSLRHIAIRVNWPTINAGVKSRTIEFLVGPDGVSVQ